ncbi:MAG: hypothetical protein AB8B67_02505 [Rickettsiaceae bacterium]
MNKTLNNTLLALDKQVEKFIHGNKNISKIDHDRRVIDQAHILRNFENVNDHDDRIKSFKKEASEKLHSFSFLSQTDKIKDQAKKVLENLKNKSIKHLDSKSKKLSKQLSANEKGINKNIAKLKKEFTKINKTQEKLQANFKKQLEKIEKELERAEQKMKKDLERANGKNDKIKEKYEKVKRKLETKYDKLYGNIALKNSVYRDHASRFAQINNQLQQDKNSRQDKKLPQTLNQAYEQYAQDVNKLCTTISKNADDFGNKHHFRNRNGYLAHKSTENAQRDPEYSGINHEKLEWHLAAQTVEKYIKRIDHRAPKDEHWKNLIQQGQESLKMSMKEKEGDKENAVDSGQAMQILKEAPKELQNALEKLAEYKNKQISESEEIEQPLQAQDMFHDILYNHNDERENLQRKIQEISQKMEENKQQHKEQGASQITLTPPKARIKNQTKHKDQVILFRG